MPAAVAVAPEEMPHRVRGVEPKSRHQRLGPPDLSTERGAKLDQRHRIAVDAHGILELGADVCR